MTSRDRGGRRDALLDTVRAAPLAELERWAAGQDGADPDLESVLRRIGLVVEDYTDSQWQQAERLAWIRTAESRRAGQ